MKVKVVGQRSQNLKHYCVPKLTLTVKPPSGSSSIFAEDIDHGLRMTLIEDQRSRSQAEPSNMFRSSQIS